MPIGAESPRKFIETEPIGSAGEATEQRVWDAVKKAFSDRDCIGYWRFPIFSKTGDTRREPDILIVDRELGIVVIEVKGLSISNITAIDGHKWQYTNFYQASGNPYQQAEDQVYSLLGYCDREPPLRRRVTARALVALPLISEKDWQGKGFSQLPSCPPLLFKDQLGPKTLLTTIQESPALEQGKNLSEEEWELLLSVTGGSTVYRKAAPEPAALACNPQGRLSVITQLEQKIHDLDLQQSHIGLEIPPGPQRIRGIAGSGKTVLLCQKAANMHLKHPDWDIALVFFTRSLYEAIENHIDRWLRHFSGGEVSYKGNARVQSKIKVLHAWGARNRPGFYRTVCESHQVSPGAVRDTTYKAPNEGLADLCAQFLRKTPKIQPLFDAVLIDEGQDLVVDPSALLYEQKQAIYWLAYQSLRPVDSADTVQRRLIWAYDEAQSLNSQAIPTAKGLFGDSKDFTRFVTGSHKGGIKKSEIMHRCYRTPAPILTAAHAIGMGFLRSEGMLTGLTRKEQWEAIGYEVTGDFRRKGEKITLHRPPENSPNPIPGLWHESVIQVKHYSSRQAELSQLAKNIKHNLEFDQLKPDRQILVVVLGDNRSGNALQQEVAQFLTQQGISVFLPTAKRLNQLDTSYPNNDPDTFWFKGGVTISTINRAKGNEAEMVHVVGLDYVGENADNVMARNQLFVAMTRARGWVSISGTGHYPLYDELDRVIKSGNTFEFINNPEKAPKRDISEDDDQLSLLI